VNILRTKKGNIRKYTTFCGGINEDGERKSNEKEKKEKEIPSSAQSAYTNESLNNGYFEIS